MGSRGARLLGVVVVVVLSACGSEAPTSSSSPSTAPSVADTTTPPAATSSTPDGEETLAAEAGGVEVELLDPGAEPRHALRLRPEAGDRGAVDMRMTMDMTLVLDGQPSPAVDIPPMLMGFELVVDEVTADTVTMSYTYDRVGLDGPDPGGMEQALAAMEGLTGTATTTRRGAYLDGRIDVPADADPALAQMLTQFDQQMASMAVPLPAEDVGVGARWRVATGIDMNGIVVDQTATYELQAFDGDTYTLDVEMEQQFQPNTIQQPGATVEVVAGTGSGRGTMTGSLRLPMAVQSNMQMTSTMESRISTGGQQQTMQQDQQVRIEMTPRGGGA